MTHDFDVKPSRRTGSILAATLVLVVGTVGGAIFTGTATHNSEHVTFCVVGGLLTIIVMLWLTSSRPGSFLADRVNWILARHRDESLTYLPEVRTPQQRQHFGTNAPPTVDEVRELKEGMNTWVPSKKTGHSRRRTS